MSYFKKRQTRHSPLEPRGHPNIKRGIPFTRLKNKKKMFFETEFFKEAAAPQYIIKYWLEPVGVIQTPQWSCTCPDFVFRRGPSQKMCKHCSAAAMFVRQKDDTFIRKHITIIDANTYDTLKNIPIGQPIPLVGRSTYAKITISPEPGYIAYTANKWRCYTCGGRDGSIYLKNKQCKHLACYFTSLNVETYVQYCRIISSNRFRTQMLAQKKKGRAAWQRFQ